MASFKPFHLFFGPGCTLALAACSDRDAVTPPVGGNDPTLELGDPLPGLTAEELAAFERGRAIFEKRFKPSEGLGPLYNATSCASCHSKPVTGGSADLYRNFYIAAVGFSLAPPHSGTRLGFSTTLPGLPSPIVPAFGDTDQPGFTLESGRRTIPESIGLVPVRSAQRNSIPVFGVGLFEFISDATILANADPDDADGDGISGRANNDGEGMGRLGLKAQANNIEVFTRGPLFNQMGVTSNPVQGSNGTVRLGHGASLQASANPNAPTRDRDGVPDPEISREDLGDLIAFSRFLAPPQPKVFDEQARRGEELFDSIRCTACHMPELESSRGPVRAYTDLLIHYMGEDLADDIAFGVPQVSGIDPLHTAKEFRTQPLWGVSKFAPYLHDGRAASLDEAVRMHGGEAESIRNAYEALDAQQREDILTFLRHL